jgi:hypothetical protein
MTRRITFLAMLVVATMTVARAQAQAPASRPDSAAEAGRIAQEVVAAGQRAAQQATERELRSIMPLKVLVVLTKYQGEKKISSLPYELTVRSDNEKVALRMGGQIAVPSPSFSPPRPGANGELPPVPFTYQNVGTAIDCQARALDAGRYAVTITIDDTSVFAGDTQVGNAARMPGAPSFRSFKSTNALILRDGQMTQFTAASDKLTGEIVKAEVTLTVVK